MEVKILRYDDMGQGIATINKKVCFVKGALVNEVVDVNILKDKKDYMVGDIKKIVLQSDKRVQPICQLANACGGCNFLHTTSLEEKNFKINKALNYFARCDNFYEMKDTLHYRNKVTFHVQNGVLGYYQEKSHDLIPVSYCYLLNDRLNKVLKLFLDHKDENFNGEVIIRENNKEVMLVIKGEYQYLDVLKDQELISNLISNDKVLKGKEYFIEAIANYKFKVHYKSFFQVNRDGLTRIKFLLDEFLKDKQLNKALDLYSGTSVLGIFLSKYFQEVVSIEENKEATADATFNKELNNITNLKVINGLVSDYIDSFSNIDLILVDPSRKGLDKKTITYLKKINSKYLIYISCHMISLKRDMESLNSNYDLINLSLVDMFPRTNKVETVAFFVRKNN